MPVLQRGRTYHQIVTFSGKFLDLKVLKIVTFLEKALNDYLVCFTLLSFENFLCPAAVNSSLVIVPNDLNFTFF